MGEALQLGANPLPHGNQPTRDLVAELELYEPGERIRRAADLSRTLTSISATRGK
jgi:hypothetical protein